MKTNKFIRLSQMPPAGAAPTAPAPAMGAPPMGDPMMGAPMAGPMGAPMGVPPMVQPMSSPPDRMEISSSLDTLGQILYDVDIKEFIANHVGEELENIAGQIWEMYGGDQRGNADPNKVGKRSEHTLEGETAVKEREATENSRWERLPKGKIITDICSLDELQKSMSGSAMGTIKENIQEAGGGAAAAGGGMPPMMANYITENLRLAMYLDSINLAKEADDIDDSILCILTSDK
jgi:hypothetical protein